MLVLGIESSCDETAAAVVSEDRVVHADVVASQMAEHRPFGGVVPEIAARAHLERVDGLVIEALKRSGIGLDAIDAVAATAGPGLIGGVMVGTMTAKAIAAVTGKPYIAVNHLEGHALTARLAHDLAFPYLLLLVSGGHCQLLVVAGVGRYTRLGATLDDAAGEAFDKVAKMLELGYPGGPAIQKAAEGGDAGRFALPRPMKGKPGCDFSFSGLKNAVRLLLVQTGTPSERDKADIAAAFERAVAESLADRTIHAMRLFAAVHHGPGRLVVAGGVAANRTLRAVLAESARTEGFELMAPPLSLCTDNGAMIAWAGLERWRLGFRDGLDFAPRPRWPLDPTAKHLRGAGVKA